MAVHHFVKPDGTFSSGWTVTHVPSGLAVDRLFRYYRQAARFCNLISEMGHWERDADSVIAEIKSKRDLLRKLVETVKADKSDGDIAAMILESY